MLEDVEMLEDVDDALTWAGTSLTEICGNKGTWSFHVSPIVISQYHAVLFNLPVTLKEPPAPHKNAAPKHWDDDHVRMPYSENNLFPVKEDDVEVTKWRWKLIKDSLSRPIKNSEDLEAAISGYNSSLPKLTALHAYFDELGEEESSSFFDSLLPKIIALALRLPTVLPGSLPLLKRYQNKSVSLSQEQIASLLANAVLCTFPWKKQIASTYPGVNFISLYIADRRPKRRNFVEKLKCIFNYFHLVTKSMPTGVVTFERKYVTKSRIPRWDTLNNTFKDTKVHIDSSGTIENNGLGFLQVDFANKNVGGGVLGYGCVQEEIRFVICPELIVSRLFVEQLTDLEAVIVTGIQRYSHYSGYAETFKWKGPVHDDIPYDEYGRRRTTVCIIDATRYNRITDQFYPSAMLRELNKAYVGFSSRKDVNLSPVATGNWGCGAFQGSPYLKALLQLMACNASVRHLVYYTFGNVDFKNELFSIYLDLVKNNVKICELWRILSGFIVPKNKVINLYEYIHKAIYAMRKQPTIKTFFKEKRDNPFENLRKAFYAEENDEDAGPSNSQKNGQLIKKDELNQPSLIEDIEKGDVIPCTPPSEDSFINKKTKYSKQIRESIPKTDICSIIDEMDGNAFKKPAVAEEVSFLNEIDRFSKVPK